MTKQDELTEYLRRRPWALALLSVAFFLMGLSMWFVEGDSEGYPYVSDGMADHVLAPLCMLMAIVGFLVALRRMSR